MNSDAQNAAVAAPLVGANGLLSTADKHASPGAVAGGQIGFNWQLPSRWLVGIEADWQWTSQKNLSAACAPAATLGFFGTGVSGFGYCLSDQSKITNFGTARARGGVLVQDTLWYATGGLAWGTVRDEFAFAGSANQTVFPPGLQPGPFLPSAATFSKTRLGWTLGAGAETKIAAGWSAKMEYLYVDLGTVNETIAIPINPPFAPAFVGGSAVAARSAHITDHIVRVGLNYHFSPFGIDAPAAPGLLLKAPPAPPTLGWGGFYAGVNAGGSIGVNSDAQNATFAAPALGTSGLLSTGDKHASPGALAGGQIGYNWQLSSRWLVGLEGDWQWTSQKNASAACTPPAATTGFFNLGGTGFGYCLSNSEQDHQPGHGARARRRARRQQPVVRDRRRRLGHGAGRRHVWRLRQHDRFPRSVVGRAVPPRRRHVQQEPVGLDPGCGGGDEAGQPLVGEDRISLRRSGHRQPSVRNPDQPGIRPGLHRRICHSDAQRSHHRQHRARRRELHVLLSPAARADAEGAAFGRRPPELRASPAFVLPCPAPIAERK